jgi:hypothetical protein
MLREDSQRRARIVIRWMVGQTQNSTTLRQNSFSPENTRVHNVLLAIQTTTTSWSSTIATSVIKVNFKKR